MCVNLLSYKGRFGAGMPACRCLSSGLLLAFSLARFSARSRSLFFPSANPLSQLVLALACLSVGFCCFLSVELSVYVCRSVCRALKHLVYAIASRNFLYTRKAPAFRKIPFLHSLAQTNPSLCSSQPTPHTPPYAHAFECAAATWSTGPATGPRRCTLFIAGSSASSGPPSPPHPMESRWRAPQA